MGLAVAAAPTMAMEAVLVEVREAIAVRRGQFGAAARSATARHIDAIIAGRARWAPVRITM